MDLLDLFMQALRALRRSWGSCYHRSLLGCHHHVQLPAIKIIVRVPCIDMHIQYYIDIHKYNIYIYIIHQYTSIYINLHEYTYILYLQHSWNTIPWMLWAPWQTIASLISASSLETEIWPALQLGEHERQHRSMHGGDAIQRQYLQNV